MTNADRIRQMTDEELAAWLAPRMLCGDCPLNDTEDNLLVCESFDCTKAVLKYLQQDAKEDWL